jgi:hypothetical protein
MSKPDFNPFDPVSAAMGALHQSNLVEAEKAKQKAMLFAGNELARVLDDVAQIQQLDAIAKAVVIATIAKWNRAKTGQL